MNDSDFVEFSKIWTAAITSYPTGSVTDAGMRIDFEVLRDQSLTDIKAGLIAHKRDPDGGRFPPTPAHVLGHIAKNDRCPGPQEAWAMCPRSEGESAWMTQEMSEACAATSSMIDEVAARMTFIEVYSRALQHARSENRPVRWHLSIGWRKTEPINAGQVEKYLSHGELRQLAHLPENEGRALEEGKAAYRSGAMRRVKEINISGTVK